MFRMKFLIGMLNLGKKELNYEELEQSNLGKEEWNSGEFEGSILRKIMNVGLDCRKENKS